MGRSGPRDYEPYRVRACVNRCQLYRGGQFLAPEVRESVRRLVACAANSEL
jgi:hypothetical protein